MYDISNIDQDVKKHTIMFEKVNIEIIKMITVILIATMVFISLSLLSGQTGKAAALLGYGLITIVLVGGGAGGGSSGIPLSLIMSFVSFLIIVVASYSADNLPFFVTAFFSVALCIRFFIRAIVLYVERQESSFIFDEEDDGEFEPVFIVDKYYKKVIGCIVLVFFATASIMIGKIEEGDLDYAITIGSIYIVLMLYLTMVDNKFCIWLKDGSIIRNKIKTKVNQCAKKEEVREDQVKKNLFIGIFNQIKRLFNVEHSGKVMLIFICYVMVASISTNKYMNILALFFLMLTYIKINKTNTQYIKAKRLIT